MLTQNQIDKKPDKQPDELTKIQKFLMRSKKTIRMLREVCAEIGDGVMALVRWGEKFIVSVGLMTFSLIGIGTIISTKIHLPDLVKWVVNYLSKWLSLNT